MTNSTHTDAARLATFALEMELDRIDLNHQEDIDAFQDGADDLADTDYKYGYRVSAFARALGLRGWRRRRYLARVFAATAVLSTELRRADAWGMSHQGIDTAFDNLVTTLTNV